MQLLNSFTIFNHGNAELIGISSVSVPRDRAQSPLFRYFIKMSKFSVKKPFTVLVGVIVAVVLGIVSVISMQLDLLPDISLPYLMVLTTYPGASSEKVEAEICEPMESSLGTINGVKNVYSICSENYGMVQLEFTDDTDLDSAMVKVSSALNTLEPYLPDDAGTPSIIEISTDMVASVYLAVSMDDMEMDELSQFIRDDVTPYYEKQNGVASVTTLGLVDKSVEVELNEAKVDKLNDKILATVDDAFAEAVEQLEDAEKQLNDSQESLNKNKSKLVKSQKDLEENKQDLADSQKELDDNKSELEKNKNELADKQADMEKGEKELNDKKKRSQSESGGSKLPAGSGFGPGSIPADSAFRSTNPGFCLKQRPQKTQRRDQTDRFRT